MNKADLLEKAIQVLDGTFHKKASKNVLPDDIGIPLGFQPEEEITDKEYDKLRHQLKELRPDSAIFKTVTAETDAVEEEVEGAEVTDRKVKHDPPLTSISKASHEDKKIQKNQLLDWLQKCVVYMTGEPTASPTLSDSRFYQAFKLDGAACALYYKKGKLVRAGLRPRDGINGEDVTEQVKYVTSIPQDLGQPWTCSVRGELICLKSDFAKVQKELADAGEDVRANPRNHAAGGIRQFKNPEKVKDMRLSFVAYTIEGLDNPPWETEHQRAIFCNKYTNLTFVRVESFDFNQFGDMEDEAKNLDYMTDGIIIGINNLKVQADMGRHGDKPTGNPKGKLAWKYAEEHADVVLKDIEWQTGRGGGLTPVGIFEGVPLAGTTVGRATLHNIGFMMREKIGIGTTVRVIKAGNIIPKVIGVVEGQKDVNYIQTCPSCGTKTRLSQNGEMFDLVCDNAKVCPAQRIGSLEHFLATMGVLGLGESRISKLMEGNKVRHFSDFYDLREKDCVACGLSERQALLVLSAIHMIDQPEKIKDNDALRAKLEIVMKQKKVVPLWKLFAAFGIESAGKSAGKVLVDHFRNFDAIRRASAEELQKVQDIGEKTAKIVASYLADHDYEISALLEHILPELPVEGTLTGKAFCLSGGFPNGKSHWEKLIEAKGGKVSGSVGKRTNFLVQGDEPGKDKADKAAKFGVPVIGVEDLQKQLN